jgi:DNA-binding NtrC family response regulator
MAELADLPECADVASAVALAANASVALAFAPATLVGPLVQALRENRLNVPVVAVGPAQPALGAKSIRLGAVEYLTEPLAPRLVQALRNKYNHGSINQASKGVIAADPTTIALLSEASQFAASSATVLVRGESGTGKEVLARFIHHNSPRAAQAFVAVNCAAIPANLLESELFGHTKGAFSGAVAERKGKFQLAHGGTLLLDEISEMDLALQAKLLRAIQEKVVDPVGGDKPMPVDVRLIATTNRALETAVAEGQFREDLYFRLSVIMLELPPLRARTADIAPLATHFLQQQAKMNGFVQVPSLSQAARHKLEGCYWKGNVRELENTLHRALLVAGPTAKEILPEQIVLSPMSLRMMAAGAMTPPAQATPAAMAAGAMIPPAQATPAAMAAGAYAQGGAGVGTGFIPTRLADAERTLLTDTMAYTGGHQQYAADLLGISVGILREKLSALGL